MRICILGNSVPLVVAPARSSREEGTYAEILLTQGHEVHNAARQSMLITDLYRCLEEDCISRAPQIVVLNFGIVEATMRVRSRRLQNGLTANAWKNVISGTPCMGPYHRAFAHAVRRVVRLVERPAFALHLAHPWVRPGLFEFALKDIAKSVFKDTPTEQVILIGMPRSPSWLEREAPGTSRMVDALNAIMIRVAGSCADTQYIDPNGIPGPQGAYSDGIHFTASGHRWIAEQLMAMMDRRRSDFGQWKAINPYAGTRILKHLHRS